MKIGLCGTMSVGKTTLVNALKELPEFKDYITRTERSIITDRTVIDVMAFALASKSINYLDKEDFVNNAKNLISEYDHIFYVSPDGVEIEDNGVRETDAEYRKQIDFTINNIVNRYPHRIKNLHKISGSTEGRIEQIKRAISL